MPLVLLQVNTGFSALKVLLHPTVIHALTPSVVESKRRALYVIEKGVYVRVRI